MTAKVTVKGEQDVPPFTRILHFGEPEDAIIIANCVEAVKKKLGKNLKINVNESLIVYCYYVVSELQAGKKVEEIIANASTIILPDKVMIGVAETLKKIVIDVLIDGLLKQQVVLDQPIRLPYANSRTPGAYYSSAYILDGNYIMQQEQMVVAWSYSPDDPHSHQREMKKGRTGALRQGATRKVDREYEGSKLERQLLFLHSEDDDNYDGTGAKKW
jgi:urease gamma subunit